MFLGSLGPVTLNCGTAQELVFLNSATSTADTVACPSGIQKGDLIVLFDQGSEGSNPPTAVLPSGFTNIVNSSSGSTNHRTYISRKIADGTESGATITGMNASGNNNKVLLVFRPAFAITAVTASSWNTENVTSDPSAQNVTATAGVVPLIVFGVFGSSGAVNPRTFTPASDGEVNSNTLQYVKYKIYNFVAADHSVDMDDEGANTLASGYLSCA